MYCTKRSENNAPVTKIWIGTSHATSRLKIRATQVFNKYPNRVLAIGRKESTTTQSSLIGMFIFYFVLPQYSDLVKTMLPEGASKCRKSSARFRVKSHTSFSGQ